MVNVGENILPGVGKPLSRVLNVLAELGDISLNDLQIMRDACDICGVPPEERDGFFCATALLSVSFGKGDTRLKLDEDGASGLIKRVSYAEPRSLNADSGVRVSGTDLEEVGNIWKRLAETQFGSIKRCCRGANSPLAYVEESDSAKYLYFSRCFAAERNLACGLGKLMCSPFPESVGEAAAERITEEATRFSGFELSEMQRKAVKLALTGRGVIVTGGPGTGKTTVICAILRAFVLSGVRAGEVALCAPTGRAARRIKESVQTELKKAEGVSMELLEELSAANGVTIHSLLGVSDGAFVYGGALKLPYRAIIIDEASMIDISLMDSVLSALSPDCRLILIGDSRQLPSVSAGAVMGSMLDVPAWFSRTVRLDVTHRSSGKLLETSMRINEGTLDAGEDLVFIDPFLPEFEKNGVWDSVPGNSCYMVTGADASDPLSLRRCVVSWAHRFFGPLRQKCAVSFSEAPEAMLSAVGVLSSAVILTPLRNGFFGASGINEFIIASMSPAYQRFGSDKNVFPGMPVIIDESCAGTEMKNGDMGVVMRNTDDGKLYAVFNCGGSPEAVAVSRLPKFSPAYAVTVHKSQGSQFSNVLVVLTPDASNPLLVRSLFYTAVTRAKERAFIFAAEKSLETAVKQNPRRECGSLG